MIHAFFQAAPQYNPAESWINPTWITAHAVCPEWLSVSCSKPVSIAFVIISDVDAPDRVVEIIRDRGVNVIAAGGPACHGFPLIGWVFYICRMEKPVSSVERIGREMASFFGNIG